MSTNRNPFKPGDRVLCVDNGPMHGTASSDFSMEKVYTVSGTDVDRSDPNIHYIALEGLHGAWYVNRFVAVPSEGYVPLVPGTFVRLTQGYVDRVAAAHNLIYPTFDVQRLAENLYIVAEVPMDGDYLNLFHVSGADPALAWDAGLMRAALVREVIVVPDQASTVPDVEPEAEPEAEPETGSYTVNPEPIYTSVAAALDATGGRFFTISATGYDFGFDGEDRDAPATVEACVKVHADRGGYALWAVTDVNGTLWGQKNGRVLVWEREINYIAQGDLLLYRKPQ